MFPLNKNKMIIKLFLNKDELKLYHYIISNKRKIIENTYQHTM